MACHSSRWKYRSPIQLYILVLLTDTTLGLQCSLGTSTDLGPKDGFMDSGNPQSAIVYLVRNVSITASSHKAGFEPWRVRITDDIKVNSLAWCPITKVHMDSYEWVQIDFEDQKNITLIQTKGNFDEADGREYTPLFRLEFSRGIDSGFRPYMNKNGQQIFTGNSDTSNTKLNAFYPAIIARRIRIVPLAKISTDVCIQAMFAGCNLDTGVELYTTTPRATAVINSVSYSDILNDQDRRNYGPGKLADATVYNSSSTTWLREYGVAFSPDSSDTVVLEITLDNYRLLKEVFIVGVQTDVLNGLFQLKIFDEARLFFAAPSKTSYVFLSSTSPRLDTDSQYQISIFNSNQRENKVVTRFLKIEMDFSVVRDVKQNLLLHEVKIMSVNANSSTPTTGSPEGQSGTPEGQSGNNSQKTTGSGGATTTKEDTKPVNSTVIGIIIGACLLVIMIVIVVIVVCYFYQRRKNGQDTPPESPSFTAHSNGNSSSGSDKGENSPSNHRRSSSSSFKKHSDDQLYPRSSSEELEQSTKPEFKFDISQTKPRNPRGRRLTGVGGKRKRSKRKKKSVTEKKKSVTEKKKSVTGKKKSVTGKKKSVTESHNSSGSRRRSKDSRASKGSRASKSSRTSDIEASVKKSAKK